MALGISFIPNQGAQQQQQQVPSEQPLQQALQMISLRVPRFGGQNAIAPDPLLQRQPGQPLPPQPGTPEWEELMRRLREGAGGGPPQMGTPGGGLPSQPMPPPLRSPGPIVKFPAPMPDGPPRYDNSNPPIGNRPPGSPRDLPPKRLPGSWGGY